MLRFSAFALATLSMTGEAAADPIILAITTFAAKGFWAQFALQLAASVLLTLLAQLLTPKPRAPEQKRELQIPRSRPPKRFAYGRNRIYGSPAPWRVKGEVLYGCLILNSRPSAIGTFELFMDKRVCTITTGDAFSFSGNGAILGDIEDFPTFGTTDLKNPRVWIGRGDQTTPPQVFLDEAPEFFEATDGWQGCTVMWVRLAAGVNTQRADRWRAAPPEFEIEADWSYVWDPRESSHDPDDPDTWTFSRNQALILLDSLRENPIRRYPLSQIHLPSFTEAANVADEQVKLHFASIEAETDVFEARYEANGLIIWTGGELIDQVSPIAEAGGGDIVRIGGRVGYAAGEYRAPMFTITDFVEDGGIEYQVLKPGRELPVYVKGVYIAPERDWQEADLTPIEVEGAGDTGVGDEGVFEMRLNFVTSATQAMRIQQITARKFAAQRTLSVTLMPEAIDVVAGATVEASLPAGFERLNGEWMVISANPALWLSEIQQDGEQKLAMRIPVSLRQTSESIYEWVPETDEQEIFLELFSAGRQTFGAPQNLVVTTGPGVSVPEEARLRVDFDAVANADYYEIQPRVVFLQTYAFFSRTESTQNNIISVLAGETYDVRVRAVSNQIGGELRYSEYAEATGTLAQVSDPTLPTPTGGAAVGGANQISVSFTAPNADFYTGTQFWGSDTDDVGAAALLTTLFGAAGETKTFVETGLGTSQTRFYFARAVGTLSRASDFTASVSATTDP
jgi:hypothetical protein